MSMRRRPYNPGRVTQGQLMYLRLLYNQAFAANFEVGYDTTHPELCCRTKNEASKEIQRLLDAKEKGWKS